MRRFCSCVLWGLLLAGCAGQTAVKSPAADRETGKSIDMNRAEASKRPAPDASAQAFDHDDQPPQPQHGRVFRDVAEFRTAAGNPPVVLSFDDVPDGTDLSETDINGVTLIHVDAPLLVVRADSTYTPPGFQKVVDPQTYRLTATSGSQVLSPGGPLLAPGPDPAIENDDVIIIFDQPVAAVGFDFLSQSADGMSFTDVTVMDDAGGILYFGRIEINSADALPGAGIDRTTRFPFPGADFWGFVSDARNIREIHIDETDSDDSCPDSNIGLDTIRFAPAPRPFCGDLNGDGIVNILDLAAWTGQIPPAPGERPQPGAPGVWSVADLNRDGLTDDVDLSLLLDSMAKAGF